MCVRACALACKLMMNSMLMNEIIDIKVHTTKEGRANAMKKMVERSIRVKKELHKYIVEHGTSVGYDPDITYAAL